MRTGKRHLIRVAAAVLASLAIAPAAQASGTSPDDRPLPRGTEAQAAATVSPDDRAYARGRAVSVTRIVGPDDRAYARGDWEPPPAVIASPDDRAFRRAAPEPPMIPVTGSVQTHGFDWGDALLGGAFGLALAMLGAGSVALVMRRRTSLRTA